VDAADRRVSFPLLQIVIVSGGAGKRAHAMGAVLQAADAALVITARPCTWAWRAWRCQQDHPAAVLGECRGLGIGFRGEPVGLEFNPICGRSHGDAARSRRELRCSRW